MLTLDRRSGLLASLIVSAALVPRLDGQQATEVASQARATVVFTRDVAPILYEHCTVCHRPGGSGPFSLLTYNHARPRARQIADVVRRRLMPPQKPESGYGGPFVGERRLNDKEIARLQEWVDDGAVEGAADDLPQMPAAEDGGWQLGTPDLIIAMPRPYTLPAGRQDLFRNFVIPIPVSETRYIKGLEFQSSNRGVAHHAAIRIDPTQASRRLDEQDPELGYNGVTAPTAGYPDGHILAWTPGQVPPFLSPGMSWRLEPGSSLVVQMHMVPADRPEPIQLRAGFYFTDVPPAQTPATLRIGRQSIDIPPGERRYVVSDRYVLPVDVEVHAVQPHAHYLAKEIKGFAALPNGTERWLIYIKDWDFHWQDVYRYRDPFWLPKGTTLQMEYTYDNSAANQHDPNIPPKRVRFGEQTTDEMAYLFLQVQPRGRGDLSILLRDYRRRESAEDIIGYQARLEAVPDDVGIRFGLANSYMQLGRTAEAIWQLRECVRLEPASSVSHYNLATVLAASGQGDEAVSHFREAITLDPADPFARNGLGALLLRAGRASEALEEFREAVRIAPSYASAHNNLGLALHDMGQLDEAVDEYEEAARIAPNRSDAHYNLGNLLRLRGELESAASAYIRVLAIDPDHERACVHLATIVEAPFLPVPVRQQVLRQLLECRARK